MVDNEWDVILIGAGQNNFALGTYLGKAGLKTVICESRLENGGRLASEEITKPGYWHNTLAYFQDNREVSPVWKELNWHNGHQDRKSTRLNSSHIQKSRMPSSA